MAQSILIVDDEKEIVSMLYCYFSKLGYTVYTATAGNVDKIFVMSEGRICEEGQHNELMKKGEKYYALVQNL